MRPTLLCYADGIVLFREYEAPLRPTVSRDLKKTGSDVSAEVYSLNEVGKQFAVTRERIRQIQAHRGHPG
jgi:hypothetical protein